jgi:hypothetical protein
MNKRYMLKVNVTRTYIKMVHAQSQEEAEDKMRDYCTVDFEKWDCVGVSTEEDDPVDLEDLECLMTLQRLLEVV